jgi:hypothetical protein
MDSRLAASPTKIGDNGCVSGHEAVAATQQPSAPGRVVFAWVRLAMLAFVALFLELLALQLIYDALDYWGLYGRTTRDSITEIGLGLVPPVAAAAVLWRSRRRRISWLKSLRRAFWVMLVVAVLPAFWGMMTTVI